MACLRTHNGKMGGDRALATAALATASDDDHSVSHPFPEHCFDIEERFCVRSQGSNPWQTQVMALGVPLLEHFPLDPVSYLRYKTSSSLTLWYAGWRRHGTAV